MSSEKCVLRLFEGPSFDYHSLLFKFVSSDQAILLESTTNGQSYQKSSRGTIPVQRTRRLLPIPLCLVPVYVHFGLQRLWWDLLQPSFPNPTADCLDSGPSSLSSGDNKTFCVFVCFCVVLGNNETP